MGITAYHVFTSPVSDGTNTQLVRPSNWNSAHALTLNAVGSEISAAFGNGGGVSFGYDGTNVTAAAPSQSNLVPYTGASTDINLNSQWINQAQGIVLNTGDISRTTQEGVIVYDLKNLCFAIDSYGGTRLQIGQENYILAYNDSGSTITSGKVVYQNSSARIEYVSGKFGDYPTIRLAQSDSLDTSAAIGVTTMDIPNNGFGFVTAFGVVNDLDTSAWTSGDILYLSESTPGALTNVSPSTPNKSVVVAHVLRSHATAGNIRIALSLKNNLSDQHDVIIASPSDGDILQYNGALSHWSNGSVPASPVNFSAGTTSNNLSALTFGNAGGVSFGLAGSVITAVAPAGGGGITNINVSAGTTSNNLSALTFANANGVSFGLNGSSVTASHNGLTTARASNDGVGLNTALTAGPLAWTVNSSGLSLNAASAAGTTSGFTGGASISGSMTHNTAGLALSLSHPAWITTAAQSNHSHGNPTLALTNLNGTTASASNGLTLSLSAAAQQAVAVSGSNGSFNFSTVTFGNLNGLSFYTSNGSLVGSHNGLTTARASTDAIGLNTAGTNVTWTANSSGLSINAAGYAGTGTTFNGANISGSITQNSNGIALSLSAAAPGAAAENNWFALTGNTTGNTTASGSTIALSAGNNITLSGTNGSVIRIDAPAATSLVGAGNVSLSSNGSTISISGYGAGTTTGFTGANVSASMTVNTAGIAMSMSAGAGGGGYTGSYYANMPFPVNTTTQTIGNSTSIVWPMDLKENETFGFIRMPHTISFASTSFASTANTVYSYAQQETHNFIVYSRGTGASSMSLQSMLSTSASFRMSINFSRNTTNNISVTHGFTYPVSNGTSSASFSYAATNSTDQISTTHITALSGIKLWDTQLQGSLSQRMYWAAYGYSSAQTTQGTAGLSAARMLHSNVVMSAANNSVGQGFGVANNASGQWVPGHGSFSTVGGATTASIPMSAISSSASHPVPFFQMMSI